ncbi:MAG: hypothetical protein OEW42_09735 [Acidimicrobiia bacterium]|nr:hypothetical protein [Acidimicrobiia bacterium]MDH5238431.1 hypothetical protein [Acidimicrobiia bacterium]
MGPGGPQYGGYHYPESSQATLAMVLGIVSLAGGLSCGIPILVAPVAWIIGQQEITAIDAQRRDPTKRGQANAGRVMGIIGTILLILGILATALVLTIAATTASTSS